MKKTSIGLLIAGVVIMIAGCFIFGKLNVDNMVDSHPWTININGIKSFPWPVFTGFVVFMLGVVFYISADQPRGHRVH